MHFLWPVHLVTLPILAFFRHVLAMTLRIILCQDEDGSCYSCQFQKSLVHMHVSSVNSKLLLLPTSQFPNSVKTSSADVIRLLLRIDSTILRSSLCTVSVPSPAIVKTHLNLAYAVPRLISPPLLRIHFGLCSPIPSTPTPSLLPHLSACESSIVTRYIHVVCMSPSVQLLD